LIDFVGLWLSGYYGGNIMRRTAILFVMAFLILMPVASMAATAPKVSCTGGTCKDLKITQFTISCKSKTAPAKVGFATKISGTVKMVEYTVTDSKTGKVAGYTRSFCTECTKKHLCACSCVIKEPGTYDVKVTAYGSGNCCVKMVKKAAFTLSRK
jgi:hypothetical protein